MPRKVTAAAGSASGVSSAIARVAAALGETNSPPAMASPMAASAGAPSPLAAAQGTAGSAQIPQYGNMNVKIYPINEDQLAMIGLLRGVATSCFTLAGACFGFGINVIKDLEINIGTTDAVVARWQAISYGSLAVALVLVIVGAVFWRKGHTTLQAIQGRTTFSQ